MKFPMCLVLVLLSAFSLLPFLAFSSNSDNPIVLPRNTNGVLVDLTGQPILGGTTYLIVSPGRGAAGGDVYLDFTNSSAALCPKYVSRWSSDVKRGTPVVFHKWYGSNDTGIRPDTIKETDEINIEFIVLRKPRCNTIWKVGDYDASVGARLLETGGTALRRDSSWFKFIKSSRNDYILQYCPGPYACPSCPLSECQSVGSVFQNSKSRLALVKNQPLPWRFKPVRVFSTAM